MEIKNFIKKANTHINYLKIIMFFMMIIFNEYKIFTTYQSLIVSFIIIFNIAFAQNIVNNLYEIKT